MAKFITISIPKGCDENWDNMKSATGGRFCASCEKTVIDFSELPDEAIARYFLKNKEGVCGRFRPEQLDAPIQLPRKELPWIKYFFTVAIPAFLFTSNAGAQVKRSKAPSGHYADYLRKAVSRFAEIPVSGMVTDKNETPLSGASIVISGSRIGTSADSAGCFELVCNEDSLLEISCIGYIKKVVPISNIKDLTIQLDAKVTTETEVTVTSMGLSRLGGAVGGLSVTFYRSKAKMHLRRRHL